MSDDRKIPYSNNKMMHPVVTWAMIFSIVTLTISGTLHYSALKAGIKANKDKDASNHLIVIESVKHENNMRILATNNINENVSELKQDVKALTKQTNKEANETQRLLRELIQKQIQR